MKHIKRKYRAVCNELDRMNRVEAERGLTTEERDYQRHCSLLLDYLRDRLPQDPTPIDVAVFNARSSVLFTAPRIAAAIVWVGAVYTTALFLGSLGAHGSWMVLGAIIIQAAQLEGKAPHAPPR